jgi:hypothetical protein
MELLTNEQLLEEGGKALQKIRGGIRFSFNQVQQFQQQLRQATPQPINRALDTIAEGVEYVAEKTPFGVAERGATATGEMVGEATGSKALGQAVGFGLGLAVPGPEISQAAKPVIPKGIKPKIPVQPTTLPPMGPSPAMALAGSRGSVRLTNKMDQLSPQMMPITITDPKLIAPGVKEGIAKTPKYAGPLKERAASIRKELEKHFPQPDKLARERSTLVVDPADPRAYKKRQYMETLPEGVPGFGEKYMHQHHLFPKGGSGAYLERMDELIANNIADEDDLVNMFAFAETLDLTMGDVLSNMLNTPVEAHLAKGGIHSTLRTRGLEKPVKSLKAKASEANNATELMQLFKDYLIEDVIPSKNIAKEINDNYLRIKGVLKAPERNAMEDFIEQLRKRGA